jgi:hypothetical protein
MSITWLARALKGTVLIAGVSVSLGGCAYDYLQRTDRVGFSAGDAVAANLEAATTDPSHHTMYETDGLGQYGLVIDPDAGVPATP